MKSNSREDIQRLYQRLCDTFGQESGMAIIRLITVELGGSRIRIPSNEDLYREERTLKIQAAYLKGVSITALSELWDLSERHVLREIKRETFLSLTKED